MEQNALALLMAGTAQVIPQKEFAQKLDQKKRLCVKLGMDPTAPDLHLGHAVVLKKMKQFQDLGHHVVFLIGDFTALIGDPTGRSKTRPPLTPQQIAHNMQSYFDQVGKILDVNKISIRYNSEWLSKLSAANIVTLCAKVTLARIIERDDFQKRIHENEPVGFHELLYPLMQAYDSVALKADVELGGTDQTFNLLMGRTLQEHYGQEPQVIMTTPLLEGLDGTQKMSKSFGNAISLTEPAAEAFGKIMSISDTLMWRYMKLLLHTSDEELTALQQDVAAAIQHPMHLKKKLAYDIVSQFWSTIEAEAAQEQFESLFQRRDYSQAKIVHIPENSSNPLWIVDLLFILTDIKSSSEAKRLIDAGAIEINNIPIASFTAKVHWEKGMLVKIGKHRIYRIE